MMVHTMVNVPGTPVRAQGEREREERAQEAGTVGERGLGENQREGERKGWVSRAAPMVV